MDISNNNANDIDTNEKATIWGLKKRLDIKIPNFWYFWPKSDSNSYLI